MFCSEITGTQDPFLVVLLYGNRNSATENGIAGTCCYGCSEYGSDCFRNYYTSAQAAVKAVQAGVDLLLMPSDFSGAYQGVLNAVYNGEISEERLNESLYRILQVKNEMRVHGKY